MAYQVGYWTELSSIALDDAESTVSTFQAIPYGKYEHPVYGEIDFTPEKVDDIVRNFTSNVRGTELDIDYDHKAKTGEAAGWVKGAEKRADGLWLTVEWTKDAWQKIKNRAYKYFSPEFADEWKHPKTGTVHKNVLFGGGITNRPFLKDILPLNMSELFAEQEEGIGMDPKKLRQLLGLPEDATDEQVEEALQQRGEGENENNDDGGNNEGGSGSGEGGEQQPPVQMGELPQEVIQLAEKSPAIKSLVESVTALQTTVATQQAALRLSEAQSQVMALSEPTDGRTLPANTRNALQSILLKAPKELSDEIVAMVADLNKTGYVEVGERGAQSSSSNADAIKKFNDEVQKVIASDKLSYADACERVASLDPQLFAEYQEASYAFREQ